MICSREREEGKYYWLCSTCKQLHSKREINRVEEHSYQRRACLVKFKKKKLGASVLHESREGIGAIKE
jgi:hypothetical protein